MTDDFRGFPFTPGSAREISDPAKAAESLAEARKAAEAVTVRRSDLDALLAVATLCLEAFRDEEPVTAAGRKALERVREVAARYGRHP